MSNRDYAILCIGHKNKLKRENIFQRELNYNIVSGWSAKPIKKEQWWPIEGDTVNKIKVPSRAKLLQYDAQFRSLGKNKNG